MTAASPNNSQIRSYVSELGQRVPTSSSLSSGTTHAEEPCGSSEPESQPLPVALEHVPEHRHGLEPTERSRPGAGQSCGPVASHLIKTSIRSSRSMPRGRSRVMLRTFRTKWTASWPRIHGSAPLGGTGSLGATSSKSLCRRCLAAAASRLSDGFVVLARQDERRASTATASSRSYLSTASLPSQVEQKPLSVPSALP
jgi:hypothetical protein